MGTHVVSIANPKVTSDTSNFNTSGRLGGLVELFTILNLNESEFSSEDEEFCKIHTFGIETEFSSKPDLELYAERIDKQLSMFMSDEFTDDMIGGVRNIPPNK